MTLELEDPQSSAEEAGLRYVNDTMPGLRRKPAGKSFSYIGTDGERITDPERMSAICAVVGSDDVLIADGHHRYATYRERQRIRRAAEGPGPWDRGLTLLVDSSDYGPQVHAIHRVITGLTLDDAVQQLGESAQARTTDADDVRWRIMLVDGSTATTTRSLGS